MKSWKFVRASFVFFNVYYICYSKSTESVNQQNSCVWSKISYWILYQTLTIYIYLESAHRDLQNGVNGVDGLDELILNIYILLGFDKIFNRIFYFTHTNFVDLLILWIYCNIYNLKKSWCTLYINIHRLVIYSKKKSEHFCVLFQKTFALKVIMHMCMKVKVRVKPNRFSNVF